MLGQREYSGRRGANIFVLLLYVIMGLYFVNYPFSFVQIPAIISGFDKWIILVGGVLMLFGGINYFRASRRYL